MRNVLILSPQGWGDCFVAKHNYAVALANEGDSVTFVNPPVIGGTGLSVTSVPGYRNINALTYHLPKAVYISSFKFRWLYNLYMQMKVVKKISSYKNWDELWCFDPGSFSTLQNFKAKKKILFIVDKPGGNHLLQLAKSADVVVSIADNILHVFKGSGTRDLLLDHGLSAPFAVLARQHLENLNNNGNTSMPHQLSIGYVGNLLKGSILDRKAVMEITSGHPEINFHFWGPYERNGNNLGGTVNEDALALITYLGRQPNVKMHGSKPQSLLAREMQDMDAFIIPHNHEHDINGGSNLHKIIEYLSTGKVIVGTKITRYSGTDLLQMCDSVAGFPSLFSRVVENINDYNTPEAHQKRMNWALQHTYQGNIKLIRDFVYN